MTRTVLLVDDDLETLELIQERFALEDVTALLAESLVKGLKLLEEHCREIDLVIVDGDLKEPGPTPHTGPIVTRACELGIPAISHTGSEASARELKKFGTVGHVQKGGTNLTPYVLAHLEQSKTCAG